MELWRPVKEWVSHDWATMKEACRHVHASLSEDAVLTRREVKADLLAGRLVGAARVFAPDGTQRYIILDPEFGSPSRLPMIGLCLAMRTTSTRARGGISSCAVASLISAILSRCRQSKLNPSNRRSYATRRRDRRRGMTGRSTLHSKQVASSSGTISGRVLRTCASGV